MVLNVAFDVDISGSNKVDPKIRLRREPRQKSEDVFLVVCNPSMNEL